MNIPEVTVKKMKIVKAFKPANCGVDNDKLYVEFEQESSVNIIHRFKRNLAAGLRIFPWFHPALYPRFKALDDKAYQLRKVEFPHHQTDIRYDSHDIALYKRLDKNHKWQKVTVDGLPDICFDPDLLTKPTGTPPKGRARLSSKRKRDSANSDGEEVCNKNLRLPIGDAQKHLVQQNDHDASPVSGESSKTDEGQITDLHAFSPASPAPPKHSMISTTTGTLSKLIQPKLSLKPIKKGFQ